MHYGIQSRVKSIYPYVRKSQRTPSPKAQLRLKWMQYLETGKSVTQCSRHFDYPQSTIRYWRKRYLSWKLSSLEDKNKRPHKTRYTTYNEVIIDEIKRIRNRRPWGKKKIQIILQRKDIVIGQSKIQRIINNFGMRRVKKPPRRSPRRNRKHMYCVPKKYHDTVGGLVYFDVKHICLPGGMMAYQFTAIDHASRVMIAKLYTRITSRCGKEFFKHVAERLECTISYVGSDNGGEFLGDLEKLLFDLKIEHVFSSPRSPKQNPFVERVIKTVIHDCLEFEGLASDIVKQQERLDEYLYDYNYIRPHEGIDNLTPNQKYVTLTTKSRTT